MARRLPGFAFETVAPPLADTLPRMDVAVFVGFAASGPAHIPVAVEDAAQFAQIFGDDLELAFDRVLHEPVMSNLGPSVRAFFRNGGVRCWIVRVTGDTAETGTFPVAGLYALRNGKLEPAIARARSSGSWADDLQIAPQLNGDAIGVNAFDLTQIQADLEVTTPSAVETDDLLRFHFRTEGVLLMLRVVSVSTLNGTGIRIVGADALWAITEAANDPAAWSGNPPAVELSSRPDAELLTFDFLARRGNSAPQRLSDLAFFPNAARFWALLPFDDDLYAGNAQLTDDLKAEASNPRFDVAGEVEPAAVYYPIGMPYLASEFTEALASARPALDRDGLAKFDSSLFLDSGLIDFPVRDLMNEADYLRWVQPEPRLLRGIHAALAVEEAALISVPDANQRGWELAGYPPVPVPQSSEPLPHPEWWCFEPCPLSPVPLAPEPDRAHFQRCDLLVIPAPVLSVSAPTPSGDYRLQWTAGRATNFILEEAIDPGWSDAAPEYEGPHSRFSISGRPTGAYYYRVRAVVGEVTSEWSNGVVAVVRRAGDYAVIVQADYQANALIDIQRSLLRMCAARGDLFAVLSLPRHYREADTLAHIAQLKRSSGGIVRSLGGEEVQAYSYGALYHSWLTVKEDSTNVVLPPDGPSCGVIAARTLSRGAWIAPANEPLENVIALENGLAEERWLDLLNAQINTARQDPHGFLWMSSDTLSEDPDLRPINVRRLMMLLRRLALQRGAGYVFEPNNETLARVVKFSFESMLTDMYDRGAFAGSTPASSFRVVTGSPINTDLTRDQGRFYVELKVAPSQPLTFLTVRLTQTADRSLVTEVA